MVSCPCLGGAEYWGGWDSLCQLVGSPPGLHMLGPGQWRDDTFPSYQSVEPKLLNTFPRQHRHFSRHRAWPKLSKNRSSLREDPSQVHPQTVRKLAAPMAGNRARCLACPRRIPTPPATPVAPRHPSPLAALKLAQGTHQRRLGTPWREPERARAPCSTWRSRRVEWPQWAMNPQ